MLSATLVSCGNPSEGTDQVKASMQSNRLIHESSPYLLEHAHDPVDWYPWGDEAFDRAKRENKPVLLSVGYSACHWCHVMQRESFQNEAIARLMNSSFVCVKVDREERPDIDEVYMRAVQAISGSGGWPMTVFLTPDRKPFFGGTYFPPKSSQGMPGFETILTTVQDAWVRNRASINHSSEEMIEIISRFDSQERSTEIADVKTISVALSKILSQTDQMWGGLGQAPKFPTPGILQLCLRESAGRKKNSEQGHACYAFVTRTLEKMSQGGIHDQIDGGFSRYSTDRKWLIPHFEKMLYDNALLADVYLNGYLVTGDSDLARTAEDTLNFMTRELGAPEGGFYSSLDADSEGEEGAYYGFTLNEIRQNLKKEDAQFVEEVYGVTSSGNFSNGLNVLHRSDRIGALAKRYGISASEFDARIESVDLKLRQIRQRKEKPRRDEKVIAAWNALAVSSFVRGYRVLGQEKYLTAARRCARFMLSNMYKNNRLHRIWARGKAKEAGCLDDYTFSVQALLDLGEIDTSENWQSQAQEINQIVLNDFLDKKNGTFFYTSESQGQPLTRTRSLHDSVLPSGTAVEIVNLIRLSELSESEKLKRLAGEALGSCESAMRENPMGYAYMLCALDRYLNSNSQIVLISPRPSPLSAQMSAEINRHYLPNAMTIVRSSGIGKNEAEILKGKTCGDGGPTVYICHGHTCDAPIRDLKTLKSKIQLVANENP
jgi:uncharacterized protein YyaL (SSP411 family)